MAHYIFGPVNSRRFGSSLGIDLSPDLKRCNFDCLYCELAPKQAQQKSDALFNHEDVIAELKEALRHHPHIDVITITANGEPTMYEGFHKLVDAIIAIKGKSELLILSNAALIDHKNIQESLMKFEQVKLSLDAVSADVFEKIDRPHESIDIEKIKSALKDFSHAFKGKLIIEILLVKGINDTKEELERLNSFLKEIPMFRIDLGTIDRPPAYGVAPLSAQALEAAAACFDKELPLEIIHRKSKDDYQSFYSQEEIINTLDKRPLTQADVEMLFDISARLQLDALCESGKVIQQKSNGDVFYILADNAVKKRQKT